MAMYNFNIMPDRHGHDSIAVDLQENDFWKLPEGKTKPGFDKIPLWIADMNFPTAPCVTEAIVKRASHPIYGYFVPSDEYYDAIIKWQKESFGVTDLTRQNIGYENGVLGGITSALQVLNPEHAPVLVHSPTYTGFTTQLERNGYPVALSQLCSDENGILRMDYDDMERQIKEKHIHTALLCSPHNPSGRVWQRIFLHNPFLRMQNSERLHFMPHQKHSILQVLLAAIILYTIKSWQINCVYMSQNVTITT